MNSLPRIALSLIAVAVLALSGCGREESKPATTTDATSPAAPAPAPKELVVRIGHAAPLTGGIAHLGKDNENGARLAIEELNAKGIEIGGRKVRFELLAEDDEAKPDRGPVIAQKFVDAKVAGVVGHLNSGVTIPASSVYAQAGVPMISGSATNPQLTEQGLKGIFRVVGRDDQQGPAIASYLIATHKPKVVAVIDDATSYGEGLANEVEKALKAAGVTVLPREKGTDRTTDWKAVLTKLRGRKPDAVFFGGMDATGGPLLKQGRELGIKAVFAFGDGACTDKMRELAGEAAEGLLCSQAGIPVQAASKAFLDAYRAKFNIEPILYAPFTYDSTYLLATAMQQADSIDPAKYLPALASISYRGASGPIAFDSKGDRKDAGMTIFRMEGGKIQPVAIIKGGTATPFEEFLKASRVAGDALRDAAGKGMEAAKDAAGKAIESAREMAGKASEVARDAAKDVSESASRMARDAQSAGKEIVDKASQAAGAAKDAVTK